MLSFPARAAGQRPWVTSEGPGRGANCHVRKESEPLKPQFPRVQNGPASAPAPRLLLGRSCQREGSPGGGPPRRPRTSRPAEAARVHAGALRITLRTGPRRLRGGYQAPGGVRGPRSAQQPAPGARSAPRRAVSAPAGLESRASLASGSAPRAPVRRSSVAHVVVRRGTAGPWGPPGVGAAGEPRRAGALDLGPGSADDPPPALAASRRGACVCAGETPVDAAAASPGPCTVSGQPTPRPSLRCAGDRRPPRARLPAGASCG